MRIRLRVSSSPNGTATHELDVPFHIGRSRECGLCLTGSASDVASWEHARIESSPEGLLLTDLGSSNGTYVNGERIQAPTSIKTGDKIGLGNAGPRIEVLSLSRGSSRLPIHVPAWATVAIVLAVGCAAALAGWSLGLFAGRPEHQTEVVERPETVIAPAVEDHCDPLPTENENSTAQPASTKTPESQVVPPAVEIAEPKTEPTNDDRAWDAALSRIEGALWLLTVEDPRTSATWPLGVGTAVGGNLLLTSATLTNELVKYREDGWKLSIYRPHDHVRHDIEQFFTHKAYLDAEPDQQIYFELGLVQTNSPLSPSVTFCDAADLRDLEQGYPAGCATIVHGAEPLNRFDQLPCRLDRAKVLAITTISTTPGGPRLLHLHGSIAEGAFGSPVINAEGRLIAVYVEPAPPEQKISQTHYAVVFDSPLFMVRSDGAPSANIWTTLDKPIPEPKPSR